MRIVRWCLWAFAPYQKQQKKKYYIYLIIAVTSNENDVQTMEMFDRKAFISIESIRFVAILFAGRHKRVIFCGVQFFVRAVIMKWRHNEIESGKKFVKTDFFTVPMVIFMLVLVFVDKLRDSRRWKERKIKRDSRIKSNK